MRLSDSETIVGIISIEDGPQRQTTAEVEAFIVTVRVAGGEERQIRIGKETLASIAEKLTNYSSGRR